jgi:hypothetical protein
MDFGTCLCTEPLRDCFLRLICLEIWYAFWEAGYIANHMNDCTNMMNAVDEHRHGLEWGTYAGFCDDDDVANLNEYILNLPSCFIV